MTFQKYGCASVICLLITIVGGGIVTAGQVDETFPEDPAWRQDRILRSDIDLAAEARQLEARGNYKRAARVYRRMANTATSFDNRIFALQRRAECLFQAGDLDQAYEVYRQLAERHPHAVRLSRIVGRLREIAEAYVEGKGSMLGIANRRRAREIYRLILTFAPAGADAPSDTMRLAELQRKDDLLEPAAATYREVIRRFPDSGQAPNAHLALTELHIEEARRTRVKRAAARDTRQMADQFIRRWPDHPGRQQAESMAREAEELLAGELLYLARFYYRPAHFRPEISRRYVAELLREYENTRAAPEARQLLARIEDKAEVVIEDQPIPADSEARIFTPESLLRERRLPPLDTADDKPQVVPPAAPQLIEQSERLEKWLRPIPDLGIDRKEAKAN